MNKLVVRSKNKVIALIFKRGLKSRGVKFLTPIDYTLQLGLLTHPKGVKVKEHIHNPKIKYKIDTTQEFLYIEKGKVRVKLFNDDWKLVKSIILKTGDFMLHVNGGHGFEVLEKCRMIEVKQGPYPGEKVAKIYPDVVKQSIPKMKRRHVS